MLISETRDERMKELLKSGSGATINQEVSLGGTTETTASTLTTDSNVDTVPTPSNNDSSDLGKDEYEDIFSNL
jgi:hypothetical protein